MARRAPVTGDDSQPVRLTASCVVYATSVTRSGPDFRGPSTPSMVMLK